jgi:phosphoglycolate phosphatase
MRLKAVIFDLDGTLIDSRIEYEKIATRVREILANESIPAEQLSDRRKIYGVVQGGDRALADFGVPAERRPALLREVERAMNEVELEGVHLSKPMRNLHETLSGLRGRGLRIGVATRGCHEYAERSMSLVGITGFVDRMIARDDVPYPKPDPRHLLDVISGLGASRDTVFYVGDTATDLKTAASAGVDFIGYRRDEEWGRRLVEAGCTRMVDDLIRLVGIAEEY